MREVFYELLWTVDDYCITMQSDQAVYSLLTSHFLRFTFRVIPRDSVAITRVDIKELKKWK